MKKAPVLKQGLYAYCRQPKGLLSLPVTIRHFAAGTHGDKSVAGVPDITPDVERANPSGNEPVSMLHVIGVFPVALSVWLYAVPTTPFGSVSVVIFGAIITVQSQADVPAAGQVHGVGCFEYALALENPI